jgi:hypothetical protein
LVKRRYPRNKVPKVLALNRFFGPWSYGSTGVLRAGFWGMGASNEKETLCP